MSDGKPAGGPLAAVPATTPAKQFPPRLDGWSNIATGLGNALRDKRMSAEVSWVRMMEPEAEDLYGGDDVAARICDTLPGDALKQWITVHCGDDEELNHKVVAGLDALQVRARLRSAWKWARRYGGAGVLVNVDDGRPLWQPLNPAFVRSIQSLVVLSRWELEILSTDRDLNLRSSRYGEPVFYTYQPRRGGASVGDTGQRIHHTRIIRFDGDELPIRLLQANGYWHDSVMNRPKNAIRNYQTAHDAAAVIMQEFNQGVFKVKDLADMIANGRDDLVIARLTTLQMSKGICRSLIVDTEEDYTVQGAAFSGVPEVLEKVGGRLVVASGMPHDKILGDSPSGLGATGDSETRIWYDFVASEREDVLRPKVQWLIELLFASRQGPTSGKPPESWSFEFKPLWQMDEAQQADIRAKQAATDAIYIERGVVTAEEVAASRFGSGKWSPETVIDLEARKDEAPGGVEPEGDDDPEPDDDPDANLDADFKESDHPRAKDGEFGSGGGGKGAASSSATPPHLAHLTNGQTVHSSGHSKESATAKATELRAAGVHATVLKDPKGARGKAHAVMVPSSASTTPKAPGDSTKVGAEHQLAFSTEGKLTAAASKRAGGQISNDRWHLKDKDGNTVGQFQIQTYDMPGIGKVGVVKLADIDAEHLGKGLGTESYKHLLEHYGTLMSGAETTSPTAVRVWEKIGGEPATKFASELKAAGDSPHGADGKDRYIAQSKAARK